MYNIESTTEVEKILALHKEVFEEGLGTVLGMTAKLHLNPDTVPKFCKASPMPFSLKKNVKTELQ